MSCALSLCKNRLLLLVVILVAVHSFAQTGNKPSSKEQIKPAQPAADAKAGGKSATAKSETGKPEAAKAEPEQPASDDQDEPKGPWHGLTWRLIGPFRGGRVLAVSGVVGDQHTYYFGATGGGVWKTTDGGL